MRIGKEARARGTTAAEIARRLGLYRSNLSAMDAGRRVVSLKMLARISQLLNCHPGELLEVDWAARRPIFRQERFNAQLNERDMEALDGLEKGWVHSAQLAWLSHYNLREGAA